jgi:D-proline reductase (dithiol) PrdB
VPFALGRPLGVPDDAAFQTRVLRAAMQLLEAPSGPVLVDFPDDAPAAADASTPLVCPVSFASPPEDLSDTDLLRTALQREIAQLRTWYDLAVTRRGRTTVGVSRLTPEEMGIFIGAFLDGQAPFNPRPDIPLAALFRYAVEDLKAYYCEALAAQPGNNTTDSTTLADWFWRETTAGRVLFTVHEVSKQSAIPGMQAVAAGLLIPRAHSAESPFAQA